MPRAAASSKTAVPDRADPLTAAQWEFDFARYTAPWKLTRQSARLPFLQNLEGRYETATRHFRIRELRLTVSLSAMFYILTSATDPVLVPDLGVLGFALRMLTIPVWLTLMVFGHRFSGPCREAFVAALGALATVLVAVIAVESSARFAAYEFTIGMLTIIYVNTTYPLRFGHAVACTTASLAVTSALLSRSAATIGVGLAATIGLLYVVAGSYSLISCYRIDRSQRLAFLLSFRESQRLADLAADRDAVTALSNTDALTGLANRGHFDRRVAAMRVDPDRPGQGIALLMLDVDHFKRYNDHHGHPAGDAALRQVAAIIDRAVRDTGDFAARYGGEEFVMLLKGIDSAQAGAVARRICEAVRDDAIVHDNREDGLGLLTVSIGVAFLTPPPRGADDADGAAAEGAIVRLIESADRALYRAKKQGRNRVEQATAADAVTPGRDAGDVPGVTG